MNSGVSCEGRLTKPAITSFVDGERGGDEDTIASVTPVSFLRSGEVGVGSKSVGKGGEGRKVFPARILSTDGKMGEIKVRTRGGVDG